MTGLKLASARGAGPLPRRAGVGFKPEHFAAILAGPREVGFFEVHAETYMGDGGPPHRRLEAIRARYPLSLHGVGLSIGSPRPLDRDHLERLESADPPLPAGAVFRTPRLVEPRRGLPRRPAAAALRRRDAGGRLPPHRRDAGDAGDAHAAREPVDLRAVHATARSPRPNSSPRSPAAPAAACCSTSTTSSSARPTTASTPSPISPPSRLRHVGEIHLAGYADAVDDEGAPLLIDAHNSPVGRRVWALYAGDGRPPGADADADRMGQRRSAMAGPARRGAPRRCGDGAQRRTPGGCAMPFEATIASFAHALVDPSRPAPAATRRRDGRPVERRFAVYRNNVAVALIGALEARYPVVRRLVGDDFFRGMAGAYVAAEKPRSPALIHYGDGFPDFVARFPPAARDRLSRRRGAARKRLGRGLSRRRGERARPRRAGGDRARRARGAALPAAPGGAAAPLRPPRRLDLGRLARRRASRARLRSGRPRKRWSRGPTPTSSCASCRRAASPSPRRCFPARASARRRRSPRATASIPAPISSASSRPARSNP